MKIRSIRLAAYGPFTGATLDLPESGPDFHLVFGPNEAGKSTALRALRHMLFGIPARTDESDESLADFIRRRLGQEALEVLAEPMMRIAPRLRCWLKRPSMLPDPWPESTSACMSSIMPAQSG